MVVVVLVRCGRLSFLFSFLQDDVTRGENFLHMSPKAFSEKRYDKRLALDDALDVYVTKVAVIVRDCNKKK